MVVQTTRRLSIGIVVACVLAFAPGAVAQVVVKNPCADLTPSDISYWMFSCWLYDFAAAFLSGPSSAFLVR
jgi:uncharacterized protein YegJ (DUF2314 family)